MQSKNINTQLSPEIRELKNELALTRANAEAIFASIGDGIIATDRDGRITQINNIALEILGFDKKDVDGKWFLSTIKAKTVDGAYIEPIDRPITQAIIAMRPVTTKLKYERKDGSEVVVSLTASPIVYKNRPLGAVEVFRDITAEFEITKMKDDFISIASHQLRTPATGVKQYVAMVLDGYAGKISEAQKIMLEKAYISNDRQLRIVDDLLRIAQLDSGKIKLVKTKVNLPNLVTDIVKEQQTKFESHQQTVKITYGVGAKVAFMDESKMRMVIENILDNASKYSPNGSVISISTVRKDNCIFIRIKDQGVGISEADIEKLFTKFTRIVNPAARDVGGSGLGLYWSKKIVDLHQGTIEVASTLGNGTVFTIQVPNGAENPAPDRE